MFRYWTDYVIDQPLFCGLDADFWFNWSILEGRRRHLAELRADALEERLALEVRVTSVYAKPPVLMAGTITGGDWFVIPGEE